MKLLLKVELFPQTDKTYLETHFPEVAKGTADQETAHTLYFDKFTRSHLLSSLRSLISAASQRPSPSDSVLPYRLLRSLMDKPEIGDSIVTDILPDISSCLKCQVESLGGVPTEKPSLRSNTNTSRLSGKESGSGSGRKSLKKSHKLEVLQSANLFFNSLAPEQLWQWMEGLLGRAVITGAVGERREEGREGGGSHESVREETSDSLPNSPISPTSSVSLSAGSSSGGGKEERGGGVDLSCSSACKLIHFLLQVLPLVRKTTLFTLHIRIYFCIGNVTS